MLASGEQPNAVTYTSLLIMWTRSRLPVAKERILAVSALTITSNIGLREVITNPPRLSFVF